MSDEKTFLRHILEYIALIEKFTEGIEKKEFLDNEEKQLAVVRCIEIIGEAVKQLPPSLREKHHEIPWKDITGTRDLLIHAYFSIDLDLVWKIIEKDLQPLKTTIEKILKEKEK